MSAEATPWAAWLRGALAFGLTPADFWALSLKEWRALTAAQTTQFDRAAFEALAAQFPDQTNDQR